MTRKHIMTITISPTWAGLMPWMLRVLEDPRASEKAKQPLRDELQRLAKAMDAEISGTGKKRRKK